MWSHSCLEMNASRRSCRWWQWCAIRRSRRYVTEGDVPKKLNLHVNFDQPLVSMSRHHRRFLTYLHTDNPSLTRGRRGLSCAFPGSTALLNNNLTYICCLLKFLFNSVTEFPSCYCSNTENELRDQDPAMNKARTRNAETNSSTTCM